MRKRRAAFNDKFVGRRGGSGKGALAAASSKQVIDTAPPPSDDLGRMPLHAMCHEPMILATKFLRLRRPNASRVSHSRRVESLSGRPVGSWSFRPLDNALLGSRGRQFSFPGSAVGTHTWTLCVP